MKRSQACPKCNYGRLWVIEEVRHADPHRSHELEAWVGGSCDLTEWYAKFQDGAMAMLAQDPFSGVRWFDASPQRGPFR